MKLFYGWILLIVLILASFYYISLNLEKTVEVNNFLKLFKGADSIVYSVKNVENNNEVFDLTIKKDSEIILLNKLEIDKKDGNKTTIKVNINRENQNVILVLLSQNEIDWEIIPSENTNIDLIIYNNKQSNVKSKSKLFKKFDELKMISSLENENFLKFLNFTKERFDIKQISFFKDIKDEKEVLIDSAISDIRYSLDNFEPQYINKNFEFELLSKNFNFLKFNLNGPLNPDDREKEISLDTTYSPDKSKFYQIQSNGLKIIDSTTKTEEIKPILIMKRILYSQGIAYDALTNRVVIASRFGKFYIFDADSQQWLSIRKYIEDYDISFLTYDVLTNTFISSTWKNEGLILFDQQGNFAKRINLVNRLKGLEYFYDKKSQDIPQLLVIAKGDDFALILVDKFVKQIWYYEKSFDKAYLTYNYYYSKEY